MVNDSTKTNGKGEPSMSENNRACPKETNSCAAHVICSKNEQGVASATSLDASYASDTTHQATNDAISSPGSELNCQECQSPKQGRNVVIGSSNLSNSIGLGSTSARSPADSRKGEFVFRSSCTLPTKHGDFHVRVYVCNQTGKEATMMVAKHTPLLLALEGNLLASNVQNRGSSDKKEDWNSLLLRVQDACFTSELLGSLKCDCAGQLDESLKRVQESPRGGAVIYLLQEGRGIGLAGKVAAYDLQEKEGYDTVDANRKLGFADDTREYGAVRDILADIIGRVGTSLGNVHVELMTNNPRKVSQLKNNGINVTKRIPLLLPPKSDLAAQYLRTKMTRMAHLENGEDDMDK